jgi:hypothetical protein
MGSWEPKRRERERERERESLRTTESQVAWKTKDRKDNCVIRFEDHIGLPKIAHRQVN